MNETLDVQRIVNEVHAAVVNQVLAVIVNQWPVGEISVPLPEVTLARIRSLRAKYHGVEVDEWKERKYGETGWEVAP